MAANIIEFMWRRQRHRDLHGSPGLFKFVAADPGVIGNPRCARSPCLHHQTAKEYLNVFSEFTLNFNTGAPGANDKAPTMKGAHECCKVFRNHLCSNDRKHQRMRHWKQAAPQMISWAIGTQ